MMVAIPPKFDAYAIESMMHSAKFLACLSDVFLPFTTEITEAAIGYIIIVVAVLLSHMLINPVATITIY